MCGKTMTDETQLTGATLELESATSPFGRSVADEIELGRWQKYGYDRLYVNAGVPKADKYDLYVDVGAQTVETDNTSAHGGSVGIEGGKVVVTIVDKTGLDDKEYELVFESDAVESDDSEDDSESDETEDGTETHECDECGDEFGSEHGLAVHEGIVHSEDEDDAADGETGAEPVAVTDGGDDYEAPTAGEFEMGQKETIVEYGDESNPYAGIKYISLEDGLHPATPYYMVSVQGVGTVELNVGIDRADFEENWSGGSWDEFLAQVPYEHVGMDVGELLVWRRPADGDSYVQSRHTLDGERVVDTNETVEEMARRLLGEMLDESDYDAPSGDGSEAMTDGGEDRPSSDELLGEIETYDDQEFISPEAFAELVLEYRDEMLKSLGVIGVSTGQNHSPGEKIRRMPVEQEGRHHRRDAVGGDRLLMDVRDYGDDTDDAEDAVAAHEDAKFATVRETTGHAAIYSSGTTTLVWSTMPTPREVRIAEYLESFDARDIDTSGSVGVDWAAEEIVIQLFPRATKHDGARLWLTDDETGVENVQAIEECVTALRLDPDREYHDPVRYRDEFGDDEPDTLKYRLSVPYLTVEKHYDSDADWESASWHRVYAGDPLAEVDGAGIDAMGYVTFSGELPADDGPFSDDEPRELEIDTELLTIPEMIPPEDVLDLPVPEPVRPETDETEDDR